IGRGTIVAQGTPQELLQDSGTYFRAVEQEQLVEALRREGIEPVAVADGFRADIESVRIGRIAAAERITLIELRPADGGLEDLFLELTAESQRESYTDNTTGVPA